MFKVIIQARTGSERLPGKVLLPLAGATLLEWVIRRCAAIEGMGAVVVATTETAADDAVAQAAERTGAAVFRGSERDVLDRYHQAARRFGADPIMRVTADCPLLDPEVSRKVLLRFRQGDCDYASNGREPATYPHGLDTEVFSFAALEAAAAGASLESEREHVSPYIWRRGDRFRLAQVAHSRDLSGLRWTVDYADDYQFMSAVYGRLATSDARIFGMEEVLALLEREPELAAINRGHRRHESLLQQWAAEAVAARAR